jgi:hypothetical protein
LPPKIASTQRVFEYTAAPVPTGALGFSMLASYTNDAERPLVLNVNVYSLLSQQAVEGGQPSKTLVLPAGYTPYTGSDPGSGDSGQLRITYGAEAAKRVIVCDLKSGSYQLPPSASAQVEVSVSSGPLDTFANPCIVSAAFAEGWIPTPARAVFTYRGRMEIADAWLGPIPDGARWVGIGSSALGVGVGQPALRYRAPTIIQDWANQIFAPSVLPTEMGPHTNVEGWGLTNIGGTLVYLAWVRFYLEL